MAELGHLLRSNVRFKHLQLIVAISERLHISRVAEHVHLSQPAVSKALAEIESMVGALLFERTATGLIETAQGKIFVRYAREALAQLGRLGEDLTAAQLGHAGTIRVGSMIAASVLVPLTIKLLKARSPNTTVRLEEGLIEPLVQRLGLGELDLVVVRLDSIPDAGGFVLEPLYQDAVVVVCAADAPLAAQASLCWADLASQPWVLPPPDSASGRRYEEALRQHGLGMPRDLVETASFLSIVTLARERQGVGLLPEALAKYWERLGLLRILPLPAMALGSRMGIARVEGRRPRPGVALFAECLKEAVQRELPDRLL